MFLLTWSQGKMSTKLSLATVSTIPWLYSSTASNSGSPRRYEELKQREQTTLVTARVNSGATSRAVSCAVMSVSHKDAASRQTGVEGRGRRRGDGEAEGVEGAAGGWKEGSPIIQGVQPAESTPQPGLSPEGLGWAAGTMLGAGEEQGGWRRAEKSLCGGMLLLGGVGSPGGWELALYLGFPSCERGEAKAQGGKWMGRGVSKVLGMEREGLGPR